MNKKITKENLHLVLISLLFLLFLAVGTLLFWLLPDRVFSPEENRNLQQLPKLTVERILKGTFSKEFESYMSDQFPARDFFIGVKASAEQLQLKKDNNGVYFGKEGYLFETLKKPEQEILDKNIQGLALLAETTGKNVSLLLVPSSAQSLPHLLPPFAPQYDQRETFDQFSAALSGKNVTVLPLFEELAQAKEQVYFKTDHHWNVQGAYLGYTALCGSLGVTPLPKEAFDFQIASQSFRGTLYSSAGDKFVRPDILELNICKANPNIPMTVVDDGTQRDSLFWMEKLAEKDQYTVFGGGNHALVTTHNEAGNGKSLFLIKDSYAHALLPYLAATYTDVHMMDLRYYTTGVYDYIAQHEIDDIAGLYSLKNIGETKLAALHYLPK